MPAIARRKISQLKPTTIKPRPVENCGINGYTNRVPVSRIRRDMKTIPIIWELIPKNVSSLRRSTLDRRICVKQASLETSDRYVIKRSG
jgi:hypothetical protein